MLIIDQSILSKAFRGELVPQDPNDESASELLEKKSKIELITPKLRKSSKRRKNLINDLREYFISLEEC